MVEKNYGEIIGSKYNLFKVVSTLIVFGGLIGYLKFKEEMRDKFRNIEKYKKELSTYVDKDKNGLSFEEHYQIRKLMNLQDSSLTYQPTLADWKNGYWNMLDEKDLVEVINSQKDLHKK